MSILPCGRRLSGYQEASSYRSHAGIPLVSLNNRAMGDFGSYIELGSAELANLLSELSWIINGSYLNKTNFQITLRACTSTARADALTRKITLVKQLLSMEIPATLLFFSFLSSLYSTAWFHCASFSSYGRFCDVGLLPDHQSLVSSLPSTASRPITQSFANSAQSSPGLPLLPISRSS